MFIISLLHFKVLCKCASKEFFVEFLYLVTKRLFPVLAFNDLASQLRLTY